MSIKQCIVNALEDLTQTDFRKFCDQLRERPGSPRIRRRAVEDKSILEIANCMVSTFTETKALQVALDTLRQINCNQEAKTLEQDTKALLDKGGRKRKIEPSPTKAKPSSTKASLNTIKFGKHEGKTFKWLLENEVDYTAYIVASHLEELEGATESKMPQNQRMTNKVALTEYVSAYPEVLEKVRFHRGRMQAAEGKVPVGFGAYGSETLKDLYESNDPQKKRYVDYLRDMASKCDSGSKMESAVKYVLQRDKARAADTKKQNTSSTTQALTVKQTNGQCRQPTYDSGPVWKKQRRS